MMIRTLLLTIKSSIIFSSNNPEIYNLCGLKGTIKPTLEHIFPKCYMNKISYNDLHNIYKCNNYINNYNFRNDDKYLTNLYDLCRNIFRDSNKRLVKDLYVKIHDLCKRMGVNYDYTNITLIFQMYPKIQLQQL